MIKIFLDSSVLVAACGSKTGASAFVLGYCRKKKIQGLVSIETVGKAKKNVLLKFGELEKKRLLYYLKMANLLVVPSSTAEEISRCEKVINPKDAQILASAIKNSADFLLSLDKKHFFDSEVQKFTGKLEIITPGDFVVKYLKK